MSRPLLIGEGVGIAAVVALAEEFRDRQPLALLGSDEPFPFRARPSQIVVHGMPDGVIACLPLLDAHGIASRLASRAGFPGCHEGSVTQLADVWLGGLNPEALAEIEIFTSGPAEVMELARRYHVPCQPVAA